MPFWQMLEDADFEPEDKFWKVLGKLPRVPSIIYDGGAAAVNLFHQGQKTHVKAQHVVFGVVHDPGQLLGVQTWVQGVQHAT